MNNNKLYAVVLSAAASLICLGSFISPPSLNIVANPRAEEDTLDLERKLLGPEHAAEHARARAQAREAERSFTGTVDELRGFLRQFTGTGAKADSRLSQLLQGLMGTASAAVGTPDLVGQWSPSISIPVIGIHTTLLPTGKVLFWSYANPRSTNGGVAYLWNPVDGTGHKITPPGNIWCGGQTLLADGRVVVAGGNLAYANGTTQAKGLNQIYTFNPFNETWTRQPDMRHGRWYPTLTTLPDGKVVITSGLDELGLAQLNQEVEVFTPSPALNGIGTLQYIGTPTLYGLYPHQFVIANGKLLLAGPDYRNTSLLNPADWTWTNLPRMLKQRYGYGSAVLLPDGPAGSNKIMMIGGSASTAAHNTTEMLDAANPAAGWKYLASLPQGRRNTNAVILPDGTVLVVGGNSSSQNYINPEREAELYNPATNTWTPMASQVESRAYHSTAILLPDGRVLSAGDDGAPYTSPRFNNDAIEIFSPPYLFKGPRPVISAAPGAISWGQTFAIGTPDSIAKAVLIAPGAVTHGNDMNQRYVPLTFTTTSGGISATAPPSANAAPPGYYMLFLLNAQGVPSVSKMVQVGGNALEFSSASYSINEAAGTATISVARSAGNGGAVTVDYTTSDGTALAGADYTASSGTLSWTAGDYTAKTFTVPITNDTAVEPNETVNLTLTNPTGGALLGSRKTAVLTILDDDAAASATLQFSAAAYSAGEAAGTATITVTRSGATSAAVAVNYASSDGTAVAGADYTASSGTVNFAAGDSVPKTFTIPITNDTLAEPNETVNLTLSNPSAGANLGAQSSALLTITDNDTAPSGDTVQFKFASYYTGEGAGTATVTVTRSGTSGVPVTVNYATSDGTALAGADYTASSGTLSWAAGDYAAKTFTVPITDDLLVEGNEDINLTLSSPTGATLGAQSAAALYITNNDIYFQFNSANYYVTEGAPTVTITVNRKGGSPGAFSVNYATSNGTALAGSDYTATAGTLNWAAGDYAAKTFTVPITDDLLVEPKETINLTLSNPTGGGSLGTPGSAVINLFSND